MKLRNLGRKYRKRITNKVVPDYSLRNLKIRSNSKAELDFKIPSLIYKSNSYINLTTNDKKVSKPAHWIGKKQSPIFKEKRHSLPAENEEGFDPFIKNSIFSSGTLDIS